VPKALSEPQARERIAVYGKNSFRDAPPPHLLQQFFRRFRNPLVLLLLFAGMISAATGEATSAAIIAAMVILSVSLDFIQEHRAEQTAQQLKQSVALRAVVMRDGAPREIGAHDIVPGDIVALRPGQLIPADGRVLSARDFFVKQAALTGEPYPVETMLAGIRTRLNSLEQDGFRTLAVAVKEMPLDRDHARLEDEDALTLVGFLGFLDPPKTSAADAIRTLSHYAVKVKVVTGDSELVTQYICHALAMPVSGLLMGDEIARLDDAALRARVESTDLFCRVNPMQKNRVILAIKANGHVVGYLGDGINDAPALHNADVGISVDTAVDVAKKAADLILLEHDLGVLANGVLEGRRTFANVRKYIMMGASSNFGNVFSMAGAALFLPFLPMQPVQILLNNILYDLSESAVPLDAVDQSEIMTPQRWDMHFLRNFMLTMGPVSSLFDFLTFYLLLQVFHAGESAFQTGWFVESLATQVLVIFIIRTSLNPLRSLPHPALLLTSIVVVSLAAALPLLPLGVYVGFVPLPSWFYGALALLVLSYLVIVQIVKVIFYRMTATGLSGWKLRCP